MRFSERNEFAYDSEIFRLSDTQTALKIYAEYVRAASPKPYPKFFEVDRSAGAIDQLWHVPLTERTVFTRTLEIPVIAQFDKPNWAMTKLGITPMQHFKFTVAALHLHPVDEIAKQEIQAGGPPPVRLDYFPQRGDFIYYIGYRLMIINAAPPPEAYWAQTNIWMGMVCEASIVPDGDARPIPDQSSAVPAERPGTPALADWPGPPPEGNVPHTWP